MKRFLHMTCIAVMVLATNCAWAYRRSLEEMQVPIKLMQKLKSFEPSAALYLKDLNAFLLSSDDTDKKETPLLFLMNEDGQVAKQALRVEGLAEMTDIESISQEGKGSIFLLSSLGLNKKGENKLSRNLFVKLTRHGTRLKLEKKVDLRSLLVDAIKISHLPELQVVAGQIEQDLDIESHFIADGELYVGLKNPQPQPNQALILNLGRVATVLSEQRIEKLSVWRTIDFSEAGSECLLSDLVLAGNKLYLTTTSDIGEPGILWRKNLSAPGLDLLERYENAKPEGLALQPKDHKLLIVFDQGLEAALFQRRSRY